MALTAKQEMFFREHLIDLNVTHVVVPFARLLTSQNNG